MPIRIIQNDFPNYVKSVGTVPKENLYILLPRRLIYSLSLYTLYSEFATLRKKCKDGHIQLASVQVNQKNEYEHALLKEY